MYELKRRGNIVEQVMLGEETLNIVINPEAIAQDYKKVQAEIIQAQDAIRQSQKSGQPGVEILEQYGTAIITLFTVLFGQENTEKLLTFYENNYVEMSAEVMPFIIDRIKPQLDKAITAMRLKAQETYKKTKYGAKWNLGSALFRK